MDDGKHGELEEMFGGMSEATNSDYENPDLDGVNLPVEIDKKSLITTTGEEEVDPNSRFLSKEDEEYITEELKKNVVVLDSAMETLDSELALGQRASLFEAMSSLGNAKTSALKELRSLKMDRKRTQLETRKISVQEKKVDISHKKLEGGDDPVPDDGKIAVSPLQLAKVMEEAKKLADAKHKEDEVTIVPLGDVEIIDEKPVEIVESKEDVKDEQVDTEKETTVEKTTEVIEEKFKLG